MEYIAHTLNLALVYVVLTVSLNLILGYGGMASMAHSAFFCLGGYVSAIVTMTWGCNFLIGISVAVVVTAAVGGALAAPFIKVQDEYLILFTIAFQMVVYHLMLSMYHITGGDSGIFGVPSPELFGFIFRTPLHFLPLMGAFVLLVYYIALKVTESPFGRILKGIREDEQAVRSLGKNVIKFKVIVFMLGTGVAAGVGGIFAHYSQFISPAIGTVDESILIIAMVVLGGAANLWGSALGAFLLIIIPEILNFLPGASNLIVPLRGLIYGILLILFMKFRPEGLIPEYFRMRTSSRHKAISEALSPTDPVLGSSAQQTLEKDTVPNGSILEVKGLSKSFGGIKAVDEFYMKLDKGNITALVGPNGCGKSTVFNIITGFLRPDKGRIYFQNTDITNFPAYKMPHIGIVRSWQDVRNFQDMTVLDNVLIAKQDQKGESLLKLFLVPWHVKNEEKNNIRNALLNLEKVGLVGRSSEVARNLSYAEQKLLAIARLIYTGAQVLLLDEPSSGIDPKQVEQFMGIIRNLAISGKTICIVEHNLEVVRGVSDTVYFMAEGKMITQGAAQVLMADPKLGEIYFGI